MKNLIEFWEHQECPALSGVCFPDGNVQLISIKADYGPPSSFLFSLGERTSLAKLNQEGELSWTACAILDELMIPKNKQIAICGETSWGSEGFVAVLDSGSRELNWLAIFGCSNPFDELNFKKNVLVAKNTLGNKWHFPLEFPAGVSIV